MKREAVNSEMPDLGEAFVKIKEHREELVHVR